MTRRRKMPHGPKNPIAAVLSPYAAHLRNLAIAYRLTNVGKWEGLIAAAEVLEEARALNLELPELDPAMLDRVERATSLITEAAGTIRELGGQLALVLAFARELKSPTLPTPASSPAPEPKSNGTDITDPAAMLTADEVERFRAGGAKHTPEVERMAAGYGFKWTDRPGATQAEILSRPAVRIESEPMSMVMDLKLGRCERALLRVLAMRSPRPTTRQQLAILADYSAESGGYANALGSLRRLELVGDEGPHIFATVEGIERAKPFEPMPKAGGRLRAWWVAGGGFPFKLGKCERQLLTVLEQLQRRGASPSRDELAAKAGYSAESGGYANALGRLRTLELVRGFRLADDLQD